MPSRRMLPHYAELEMVTGTTGQMEPIFEDPIWLRCLFIEGESLVQAADGRSEVGVATAFLPIDISSVPVGSRFTAQGRAYTVLGCQRWSFPGRPRISSMQLTLGDGGGRR